MAETRVVYVYQKLDDDNFWSDEKILCFICAVKNSVNADLDEERIKIKTTDFTSHKCSDCENSLEDEISI